jgi:putative ABC transport system substrate-binding protein
MRRRQFLGVLSGAVVGWPLAARAQTGTVHRVAFLVAASFSSGSAAAVFADRITRQLKQSSLASAANLEFVRRAAEGHLERLPALVTELVAMKVDVIVTGGYPAAVAAKAGTSTVPIVINNAGDPVKTGLVASLNRPGGNITGVSDVAAELAPKRLEILKEVATGMKRVAMLWNPNDRGMTTRYEASAAAAQTLGVTVESLRVREAKDFEEAFAAMDRAMPDGLYMVADMLTTANRKRVYEYAAAHGLPAIYEGDGFARDGGLMSYSPDPDETAERAAQLVQRILKGASPGDLPVEQPTRFRLVINLKTAKALGLTVPPTLLARADEVIE